MPVTFRDIAAAAGVSPATVSYALRDHARIPAATRARVRRVALDLGYREDPALAAYMRARRTGREVRWSPVLAFLTDFPGRDEWTDSPWATRCREAAGEAAEARGHRVETYWRPDLGPSVARAGAVLLARGIRGVFVSPFPEGKRTYDLPWDQLAVVALDASLAAPAHHCVYHDTAGGVLLALDEAERRGYRRPGIAMRRSDDLRSDSGWIGGYLDWHFRHGRAPLPPLLFDTPKRDPGVFRAWFLEHRPDVVLSLREPFVKEILAEAPRSPGEAPAGAIALNLQEPDPDYAGILVDGRAAGRHAADLLVGELASGRFGPPATPVKLLVRSRWIDGPSLPGR